MATVQGRDRTRADGGGWFRHVRALLGAVIVVVVLAGCGDLMGNSTGEIRSTSITFVNQTDGPVTVTYDVAPTVAGDREVTPPLRIPAGGTDEITPRPNEDRCLVGPLVVTDEAGDVIETVPEGHCYGDVASDEAPPMEIG